MANTEWYQVIGLYWACVPPPEREAAILLAEARQASTIAVPQTYVKFAFDSEISDPTGKRWEAFVANWALVEFDIDADPTPIPGYWTLNFWISALAGGFTTGEIVKRPAQRCRQLNFLNQP